MSDMPNLADAVEFAENPEPRCPCVLLLDTSGSMAGQPIQALNDGLQAFRQDLSRDALAARRVEVAVVSFYDRLDVIQDFVTVDRFVPRSLRSGGLTFTGAAVHKALDMLDARKAKYREHGVVYYRPWIFLITDGEPQGEDPAVTASAARRLKEEEDGNRVVLYGVGVKGADMQRLAEMTVRPPVRLDGLRFSDMFLWLSASMQAITHSRVTDQVALPPPGWGSA